MTAFFTFITANIGMLVAILSALVGAFALIAKLTPTPKDDRIAAAIMNALNLLPETARKTYQEKTSAPTDGPTKVI